MWWNFTWAGKIVLSKMFLLPHLLYMFRTLPIPLFCSQLDTLQCTINNFIWDGNCSKVKHSIMCTATSKAGMGAPNLKNYYKAVLLNQTQHWCSPSSRPLWAQIEESALHYPTKPLLVAIWLQHQTTPFFLSTVNATLKVWSSIHHQNNGPSEKRYGISSFGCAGNNMLWYVPSLLDNSEHYHNCKHSTLEQATPLPTPTWGLRHSQ